MGEGQPHVAGSPVSGDGLVTELEGGTYVTYRPVLQDWGDD